MKKTTDTVFIEVLQNGEILGQLARPLKKRGAISIGASRSADVLLPFYPQAEDLQFIDVSRGGLNVELDIHCEGFISQNGQLVDIAAVLTSGTQVTLKSGDYACIYIDDLNVLVRIGKDKIAHTAAVKRDRAYRGKLLQLIAPTRIERQVLLTAALAAMALFVPTFFGLFTMQDSRPRTLVELDPNYMIAFFHPNHFRTVPEALQENLDRTNYYRSTLLYYTALAEMFSGGDKYEHKLMYPSAIELNATIHEQAKVKLARKVADQQAAEEKLFSKAKTAIFSVPSVQGESLQGNILRIIDKLDSVHKNHEENLELRRKITQEFPEDRTYDYTNYKNLGNTKNSLAALSKIAPFELFTNEETMYRIADSLADAAAQGRRKLDSRRVAHKALSRDHAGPIGIDAGVQFASFINNASLLAEDTKIDDLIASRFSTSGSVALQEKIKEPLIGEIAPQLIEKVITRNKYELQLCYELALRRNQLVDGKMEWSWRIDSRGQISDIALLSTDIRDRNMVRCVRQKIASWNFPRPDRGSVEVTYPFHFTKTRG